jgi:ligand-binding SRPBCC domain-containing protein
MRVRITAFVQPRYFQDTMIKGPFHSFQHDHTFEDHGHGTLMTDRLRFQSPVPILGAILETLVLSKHLKHLLLVRNRIIKSVAESEQWHKYLSPQS